MNTLQRIFYITAVLTLFLCNQALPAPKIVTQTRKNTEWLGGFSTRIVGTAEHDQCVNKLLDEIRKIPDVKLWTHDFDIVMPITDRAEMVVSSGKWQGEHKIYPIWPASSRLNTTPSEGIKGKLIYVIDGTLENMPAKSLRGQIAVMDMEEEGSWMNAANFGATAVLVLGSPKLEVDRLRGRHLLPFPVYMPRFYVPQGPLAEALRNSEIEEGHIFSDGAWREVKATNIYALVMPNQQAEKRQALTIAVQLDSMSVVPGLAPGADGALDVAFALNCLRYFAETPPPQPILFAFVDAFCINMHGVRQMLGTLGVTLEDKEKRIEAEPTETHDKVLAKEYRADAELVSELAKEPNAIHKIYQAKYRSLQGYIRDEAGLRVAEIDDVIQPKRLATYATKDKDKKQKLQTEIDKYVEKRTALNSALIRMLDKDKPLTEGVLPIAESIWEGARKRIVGQLAEVEERLAIYRRQNELRKEMLEALGLTGQSEYPLGFFLGVDLSDAGITVGPMIQGDMLGAVVPSNAEQFLDWLLSVAEAEGSKLWPGSISLAVDTEAASGFEAPSSHMVGTLALLSEATTSFAVPGITWGTLDGYRSRLDTPNDKVERLDWKRLTPQIQATFALIKRLAQDKSFTPRPQMAARWRRVCVKVVGQAAGEPLPRLPLKGFLASMIAGRWDNFYYGLSLGCHGVRRQEFVYTGYAGQCHFEFMPSQWGDSEEYDKRWNFYIRAWLLAEDGSITRTLETSGVGGGKREAGSGSNLQTDIWEPDKVPLRGVAFTCSELNLFQILDPRFLVGLKAGTVLDARRNNIPQEMDQQDYSNSICCLLPPDTIWQIIFRVGVTGNRMLLVNMMEPEESKGLSTRESMKGFPLGEPLPQHIMYLAARDFYLLDSKRLNNYRKAGITSKPIEELQDQTRAYLAEVEEAIKTDDGGSLFRASTGALSNEVRAYNAVRDLANDVVRAAIFLLLVLVPFAFALERLLIASPYIYRQITGSLAIFTVMAIILWSFHPAFRISSQPLIIIMAFAIIFMSLLVTSMVFSKFKAGIVEFKSSQAEASGARTSRMGLAATALKLGIANMRKRKLRTALTGITIMLITFALLCFMSTSSYTGQREFVVKMKESPSYTGVLIRQPGQRTMSTQAFAYIRNFLGEEPEWGQRWWWVNPILRTWRIHARNPRTGAKATLSAALGLSENEAMITRIDRFCTNWERFEEENGCYLSVDTAEELGLQVGDEVVIAGLQLELLGTFEPLKLNQEVIDLDGTSLMPMDFHSMNEEERKRSLMGNWSMDLISSEIQTGQGLQTPKELPRLDSQRVVIMHHRALGGLTNYTGQPGSVSLRSICIATGTLETAKNLATKISRRLSFPVYYGSPEKVRVMATTPLLPRPPKSLLIPLIIAGFIIFNTMLSSIAERKREIYIYTSLGLAPLHVGVLFLAEAVTYGLMGSIFGYVVGQGLATLISKLGWLGGITLNYSGTQAIATMALVLVVVIISSLIPAYLAGKLATPSNEMRWRVPEPEGDIIRDILPFTVTKKTANGVMAFLADYFEAHREGSIGRFSTDELQTFRASSDRGPEMVGIKGTVWLAPYDLSVRQQFAIRTRLAEEQADVYSIEIELQRGSGQMSSWVNLNKTFLSDLRRQLLGWRNLKTQRILEYIAEGGKLLLNTQSIKGPLPV